MADGEAAQLLRYLLPSLGLDRGKALAHLAARGVDLDQLAGLGVDQRELADGGQPRLARVTDLDRGDRVVRGERAERADPGVLVAEVGDHDDEARLGGHAPELDERVRERA